MLIHIVVWKYKEETPDEVRAEHRQKLKNLPNVIPNIERFDVGADILHLKRSYDTGLVAVFPDRAALDFYSEHEDHKEVVKIGRKIVARVASVDFLT